MAKEDNFDVNTLLKADKESRGEILPKMISRIHSVPKQVSDTSQVNGLTEKNLRSGSDFGTILPSQTAHDRWLSINDAIIDSLIIFLGCLSFSLYGLNNAILFFIIPMFLYILIHIAWWENCVQWHFTTSVSNYIKNTRKYYYYSLILSTIIFNTVGLFLAIKFKLPNLIFNATQFFSNIFSIVENFIDVNFFEESISNNINEIVNSSTVTKVANEFSDENTYNLKQNVEEITIPTSNPIDITKLNEDFFYYFVFYTFIFAIIFYLSYLFFNKYYISKRDKRIVEADDDLKSDLETKMDALQKIV